MKKSISLFLIFLSLQSFIKATTITSNSNGNWSTGGTWIGGVAPGPGDNAVIATGHTINLTTNQTIVDVTLNGSGILNLNTATRTLTVNGDFIMNNTSAINGNGTDRVINIAGTFTVSGGTTSTLQNIALSVTGLTTIAGTLTLGTANTASKTFGDFTVTGTFTNTANNVPITISGDMINNGTFNQGTGRVTFTGGNTTVSGSSTTTFNGGITVNKTLATNEVEFTSIIAMTPTNAATELIPARGIFKLSSASTIIPFFANKNTGAPYDVDVDATVWLNHPSAVMNSTVGTSNASSWSILGTLRLSSGTMNIGSALDDWLAPRSGATILIEGGNMNITGRLSQMGEDYTVTITGGTLTVGTIGNTTASRPPFNLETSTKTFNMSAGTIIIQNPGIPGTENSGYYNKSTTGTGMTGGTIQIGNTSTPASRIFEVESTNAIYNLVVNSANATARIMNNNHTITNDLTITDGILDQATDSRDLTVGGDWTNASSITDPFLQGTRTVTFNGTAAQTITNSGNANGTIFYNVTINNSFGTIPQISLAANTTVQNTLVMTKGKVDLNSKVLMLGTSAAAAGTLTYTAGWLYGGTFTRWMGTAILPITNARGLFPMGTFSVDYRPVWVGYTAALTTGGTISVVHNPVYPSNHTPITYTDVSWSSTILQGVSNSSWVISSANSFTPSASNVSLRFGGTGFQIFTLSDLNASLAASAVGTFGAATSTTVPLEVNRTALSNTNLNNTWYIGTKNIVQSPLPVELVSFTAELVNNYADLRWTTATETSSDYYTLEKTSDGIHFEYAGTLSAIGNGSHLANYLLTDKTPYSGISYYRLKETDFNGEFHYSKLVMINNSGNENLIINVFPNPASNQINLISSKISYTATLVNTSGQQIMQWSADQKTIDVSALEEGIYVLNLFDGVTTGQHKLVIKH